LKTKLRSVDVYSRAATPMLCLSKPAKNIGDCSALRPQCCGPEAPAMRQTRIIAEVVLLRSQRVEM